MQQNPLEGVKQKNDLNSLKNHPGISVETGLKGQGGSAESNKKVAASAQAREREEVSVEMDVGSTELAYELTECGRR